MIALIVVTMLLRVGVSAMMGLGVDESYMVAAGRSLQLSYYDHPPLGWWLARFAASLLQSESPLAVRLPFILLFSASTWLMYRLTSELFSRQAGLWAATAFNISPVFGFTTASWVLPDGPLVAALLGFALCLVCATRLDRPSNWGWWLGTGLCAGMAMLSKYTAILVLAGAVAAMLTHPAQRRWLLRPQPWVASALAVVLFTPVIVWNAEHNWTSIAFQGGRAMAHGWHPFAPFAILGGEALYLLPWLWLPMMTSLAGVCRHHRSDWHRWLLACSAMPAIGLFALVGLWSHKAVLFHWAAPGYLMLFPLLGASLTRWSITHGPVLRRVGVSTAAMLVVGAAVVGSEVRWDWLSTIGENFQPGSDPDTAAFDWTSLKPELQTRGWIGPGRTALAALNWHDAGKLSYALGRDATVFCLGADPREFGLIDPATNHVGQDVLVITPKMQPSLNTMLTAMFDSVEPQPPITLLRQGRPAIVVSVYLGRHLVPAAVSLAR